MSDPSTSLSSSTTLANSTKSTHDAAGRDTLTTPTAAGTSKLTSEQVKPHLDRLFAALRHYPDFPIPGIDFIDILPIFADPTLQESLLIALEHQILTTFPSKPDVIVALDARGFLFGPSLALRMGCRFAPVRKVGKLPGPVVTATYVKEYGTDKFQMQIDAVKPGQSVLVVDDIIATGGSAEATGALIEQLGGTLLGYLFCLEIEFLKGRDKLNAPVTTLLIEANKPT